MGGATGPFGAWNGGREKCFNRRGDSLGGATNWRQLSHWLMMRFNRRGDSLGGATRRGHQSASTMTCFNRRGDSLGGATSDWRRMVTREHCFNRRGDSLGGATGVKLIVRARSLGVSIAEAILWGEQQSPAAASPSPQKVSIAEAILWGEQPSHLEINASNRVFQSQRRFFGGSNSHCIKHWHWLCSFNRRGDSLGGAT